MEAQERGCGFRERREVLGVADNSLKNYLRYYCFFFFLLSRVVFKSIVGCRLYMMFLKECLLECVRDCIYLGKVVSFMRQAKDLVDF